MHDSARSAQEAFAGCGEGGLDYAVTARLVKNCVLGTVLGVDQMGNWQRPSLEDPLGWADYQTQWRCSLCHQAVLWCRAFFQSSQQSGAKTASACLCLEITVCCECFDSLPSICCSMYILIGIGSLHLSLVS